METSEDFPDTEIDVIDGQHARIAECIEVLREAMALARAERSARVRRVLNELNDYVNTFSYEESLLEMMKFPGMNVHKKRHDLFIQRMNRFVCRFDEGEDITAELRITLERWLVDHVDTETARYNQFITAPSTRPVPAPAPRKAANAGVVHGLSRLWHRPPAYA
jgi:hemerythrin-like metal-binding protein